MKSSPRKSIMELCRELHALLQGGSYQCIVVTSQIILLVPNKENKRT